MGSRSAGALAAAPVCAGAFCAAGVAAAGGAAAGGAAVSAGVLFSKLARVTWSFSALPASVPRPVPRPDMPLISDIGSGTVVDQSGKRGRSRGHRMAREPRLEVDLRHRVRILGDLVDLVRRVLQPLLGYPHPRKHRIGEDFRC